MPRGPQGQKRPAVTGLYPATSIRRHCALEHGLSRPFNRSSKSYSRTCPSLRCSPASRATAGTCGATKSPDPPVLHLGTLPNVDRVTTNFSRFRNEKSPGLTQPAEQVDVSAGAGCTARPVSWRDPRRDDREVRPGAVYMQSLYVDMQAHGAYFGESISC